jgi:hypothetical protein
VQKSSMPRDNAKTRREASVNDAAKYADEHPATIRRWIATGLLPNSHRLGVKLIRVSLDDIDALHTFVGAA